jgi:Outer membrane protein beta-barrel domain
MKHSILIFLILVSGFEIYAQDRLINPEVYLGANFGLTESRIMFNPSVGQGMLMGYNGGLVFRYIAEKNAGVQLELNYSQRGWTESSGLYAKQLNYLELPFMTHIYMGKKNRFFINIGPKISYLLSEKELLTLTSGSTAVEQISNLQNRFDYGLCGGIGLLFSLGKNVIQLDSRVNYSLNDIYSNKKSDYFSNSNNFNISVNLAWMLKVK